MSSISDFAGRKMPQHAEADTTSPFVMRKVQSSKAMAASLTPSPSHTEEEGEDAVKDPLIQGLIQRLPSAGNGWSLEDRARWLRTAASIFNLIYTAQSEEQKEITIGLADR